MKYYIVLFLLIVECSYGQIVLPPGDQDGQVNVQVNGNFLAWDAVEKRWLDAAAFWQAFAKRGRGRVWPSGTQFPPYAELNEHDTFMYEREGRSCLMVFFHTRWRRANDVWRWGPEFNEFGSCPQVFD